jgi:hypothetical protein
MLIGKTCFNLFQCTGELPEKMRFHLNTVLVLQIAHQSLLQAVIQPRVYSIATGCWMVSG